MTGSKEDYLKAIYELGGQHEKVSNKDISIRLGISAPSVSEMIKNLLEKGYVEYSSYKKISLTPLNEDQVLVNLYHIAMNHDDSKRAHDVSTILSPLVLSNKRSAKARTKRQLENLKQKGFANSDEQSKWFITEEGIGYIRNYLKRREFN